MRIRARHTSGIGNAQVLQQFLDAPRSFNHNLASCNWIPFRSVTPQRPLDWRDQSDFRAPRHDRTQGYRAKAMGFGGNSRPDCKPDAFARNCGKIDVAYVSLPMVVQWTL
jgi:hypothetical protein